MLETNKPEELENEENFGCVTLTDENGQEADFEILDLILYQEDQCGKRRAFNDHLQYLQRAEPGPV